MELGSRVEANPRGIGLGFSINVDWWVVAAVAAVVWIWYAEPAAGWLQA